MWPFGDKVSEQSLSDLVTGSTSSGNQPVTAPWETDPIITPAATQTNAPWDRDPIVEVNSTTKEAQGLIKRFGKQIANAIPEISKEAIYGIGGGKIMSWPAAFMLNCKAKERGIDLGIRKAHTLIKEGALNKLGEKIPEFNIPSPTTTGEKVTDVAAGITKFVAELYALKKVAPGVSEKVLWEVQNLLSGGNPGEGAAMHTVFGLPGKVIKGSTAAAKAGRLAAESTTMGGLSAVEQKLTTGEIKWEDVAISAGIPVGLRSLAYIKAGLRRGDPKITKAIADLHPELLERMPNLRTVLSVSPQQRVGALKRFARYAGKEPLPGQESETVSTQPDVLSMPGGTQVLETTGIAAKAKSTTFGREPNLYRTVSGSRTGITEQEVGRIGERYVDKVTGEDIIPDTTKAVQEGSKPEFYQRWEEPGVPRAEFTKPHGIYTHPVDIVSPFANEPGWKQHFWKRNPDIKVLELQEKFGEIRLRGNNPLVGAGAWALKKLSTPEQWQNLLDKNGPDLRQHAKEKYPNVNWKRYYDRQEIFEALGGLLAKEKGYDAIELKPAPGFKWTEFVGLTEKSLTPVEELPQPEPTPAIAEGRGGKAKTITVRPSKRKGLAPTLIEEQPALIPTTVGNEMPVGISRTSTKVSQLWDSAPAKEAEAKLGQWTKETVPVGQAERKEAVGELHKRQAAGGFAAFRQAWKGAATSGDKLKALLKIKSGFGGKAEVPEFTPPDLTGAQWDIFAARAKEVYVGKSAREIFELSTVGDALNKIKRGFVPTPGEFGLLKPVLGEELTTKIWEATRGLEPVSLWDVAEITKDGLKSIPLGIDIQAKRQGSTLAWRHPIIRAQMIIAGTRGYFPWFKGGDPYAKQIDAAIKKSPNYKTYAKIYGLNWVSTDPWATVEAGTKIQFYGRFPQWLAKRKFAPARKMGEWLMASERGAVAGINLGLKLLGDVAEKELQLLRIKKPMTQEQMDSWRTQRGKTINAMLKRTVAHSQAGKRFQSAANWLLISPSHTVSRPYLRWRAFSTLFSKTGDWKSRTYAAQVYGLHLLRTTAIGYILGSIGHKLFLDDPTEAPAVDGSANPLNSLYGKARWGNHVFDVTGGDAGIDRDLARLAVSGYLYGKELITGQQQTQVAGTRVSSAGETITRHFSNKEAMHFAFLKTILTGKDWLGRDIESWKAITKAISPTQLVSVFEAWSEDGILEAVSQRDPYEIGRDTMAAAVVGLAEMTGGGVQSYAVPAYQQERMFLDEMSVRKHNLKWDYLSPVQQARLKSEHKDILAEFDEQKKLERIENPYDPSKLIEEQRKTGKRIKAKLDEPVQQLLEDIDLSVSRSQNNFMLNDKRFNAYQTKLVEKLNQLIPKTRADRLPPSPMRRKALESIVQKSKQAAFSELMKEINQ